jgi:hypothetical protein
MVYGKYLEVFERIYVYSNEVSKFQSRAPYLILDQN